ncbi:MAG: hypothetical protein WA374_06435 [Acidobacteriaceae bacterium]
MNHPAASSTNPAAFPAGEVLYSDQHTRFTVEDIAKAVRRHKREHPEQFPRKAAPQKTTSRH